ncbi:MAG: cell division protein FtsZ, partial [candidate division KSB1 bacterium]
EAFRQADDVLLHATKGIADLISVPGFVNLDFADVRTVMSEMGDALMGGGVANGDDRAVQAAQRAICSPLLEDVSISGALGVLVNITGGESMSLHEVNDATSVISEAAGPDANIIFGAVIDPTMGAELRVTVIATGFQINGRMMSNGRHKRPARYFDTALKEIDVPAYQRKEKNGHSDPIIRPFDEDLVPVPEPPEDYDIPAFLRRRS